MIGTLREQFFQSLEIFPWRQMTLEWRRACAYFTASFCGTDVNALDISISSDLTKLQVGLPWRPEERAIFSIPQFYGGLGGDDGFLIDQTLTWKPSEEPDCEATFSLDVPSEQTGIEFSGRLSLPKPGEVLLRMKLKNAGDRIIEEGHHTVLLSMPKDSSYDDPDGKFTFFHADIGWISLADLCARIDLQSLHLPIRIGSNFNGLTVIWNLIARVFPKAGHAVAMGLDRMNGYAFASDHPDWGTGLLAGFRWGAMMKPGESREAWLRLYFLQGGLEPIHQRFSRDRRER